MLLRIEIRFFFLSLKRIIKEFFFLILPPHISKGMRRKGFVLSDENGVDNKRKVNKIKWTIQQVGICDENIKSRDNGSLKEFKECV